VPKGLGCGLPDIKPPKPQPVVPQPIEIFFKLDRPFPGETSSSVGSVTTTIGKDNFNALVSALKQDSSLKVQLVGRASPEGGVAYNLELGARRARLIAAALKDAGVPESQIADPPVPDLSSDCQAIKPGVVTCGKTGSTGERDRQVLSRVFHE
jgi:hypothetical protein